MSILEILVVCIIVAILIRTGSIGKAFSFFMAYLFFPVIFGLLGSVLFKAMNMHGAIGCSIGAIVGLIMAFKKGTKNMK